MSNSSVPKVIRDGLVAVLYSPEFGAGWHTWGAPVEAVFDPELVEAALAGDMERSVAIAERKWPGVYTGGLRDLTVAWLPVGTPFRIDEYDGKESIVVLDPDNYITA